MIKKNKVVVIFKWFRIMLISYKTKYIYFLIVSKKQTKDETNKKLKNKG